MGLVSTVQLTAHYVTQRANVLLALQHIL